MLNFGLQIVCSFLMGMSLIFIIIEVRSRFDKSFLIFGITNLLLALFCAIDIWIQPGAQTIHWTRIQHVIAGFFPAFILWYLSVILQRKNYKTIRFMFFFGVCFSLMFYTNLMLRPSQREIVSTPFYNVSFVPYMLIAMLWLLIFLIRNVSAGAKEEKKILWFHLIGLSLLSISGIVDMITVIIGHRVAPQVASFSTIGLLLFGITVTYVFTDRLTTIIKDRETTFGKLQQAYKEMEEVQSLKELGQSTAIINHEIRNYAFVINGYAQFIHDRAELSEKHKKIMRTIADTATKMADFSKEILNFSKAKILSDKRPLAIFPLIKGCAQTHFPNRQGAIIIDDSPQNVSIHGDWSKLEHVFVNIFKNAFEAGASKISIKSIRRDTGLLLVVEDDGEGCTEEQLGNLFKSFYTTKKGKGGTGLGMCVMRSIVEGHGGYISAYSKNILNNGTRGLVLNIAFPIYKEEMSQSQDKKDLVVLIKEGVENLAQVIRLFQNVVVTPYIVQRVEDIDVKKIPLEKSAIYASAQSIEVFKKKFLERKNIHSLINGAKNIVFVVNESKDKTIQAFSENYILENLEHGIG